MKKTLLAALLLALAAAGGWSWHVLRGNGEAVRYRLAKVERGPIEIVVTSDGKPVIIDAVVFNLPE